MEDNNIIEVKNVSLRYNKPSEKITTLREFFMRFFKGKLRYDEFWALNNINLEVKKGESLGLIGLNGSGKTTLLKIIAGILQPTKGSVKVCGTIAPLLNLGAGFDMEATAKENVFLNGAILGYSKKQMKQKYDSIVKFAELEDFMNVPLKNFSSGMLSRLGFAIAVDVNPDILLVDEILAVGDINFRQKCQERIKEILASGTTLIYVSHSFNEVKQLCTKCLWIKDHEGYMYGDTNEVVEKYLEFCKQRSATPQNELINTNPNTIPVVFCTDNNYFQANCVAVQSVIDKCSNNYNYEIYIFHDNSFKHANEMNFNNLKPNINIRYVNVENKLDKKGLYAKAHFSKTMYYRWLIPQILNGYKKAVYLDSDLIVNADIADLLQIDLEDKVIGAVANPLNKDSMYSYVKNMLDINPKYYANSGVLVFDIEKFNQGGYKNKCFHLIKKNKAFVCPDQDALNIVLKEKIKFMPLEWNFQSGNNACSNSGVKDKFIIHYTAKFKPWHTIGCRDKEYFWNIANKYNFPIKVQKIKKESRLAAVIFKPFRLMAKFFRVWKSFGFKKAMNAIKNKFNNKI